MTCRIRRIVGQDLSWQTASGQVLAYKERLQPFATRLSTIYRDEPPTNPQRKIDLDGGLKP